MRVTSAGVRAVTVKVANSFHIVDFETAIDI